MIVSKQNSDGTIEIVDLKRLGHSKDIDYTHLSLRLFRDGQRCSWKDKIPAYIDLKQYR